MEMCQIRSHDAPFGGATRYDEEGQSMASSWYGSDLSSPFEGCGQKGPDHIPGPKALPEKPLETGPRNGRSIAVIMAPALPSPRLWMVKADCPGSR